MAKPHPHIIKRQILELQGLRQEDANEMQERMRRLYHSRLLPLIDSYLSQLSPNGQAFHIEKLELDLGTINMLDFEAAIVEQLEKQLQAQLSQFSPPDTTAEEQSSSKPEKPGTRQWALFRYFMETGSLP